jgi:hypothetical protein
MNTPILMAYEMLLPIEAEVVSMILINEFSLAIYNCMILLQSGIHNGFANIMFLHSSTPDFAKSEDLPTANQL